MSTNLELVNRDVVDKGSRIAKAFMEGGSAGWSTLVGRNVTYTFIETDYGKPEETVKPEDRVQVVLTRIKWEGDHSGNLFFVVSMDGAKDVVAYMTALMLGDEANTAETKLDAEGMDAYSEAVNSFVGQAAQQARGETGETIKTSVQASTIVDLGKNGPNEAVADADMLCFRIKTVIEGSPPFTLLLFMDRSITGVAQEEHPAKSATKAAEELGVNTENLFTAMKIKLPLIVHIASKKIRMELIQDMSPGTIIEFRKMSGEPLDVYAGNVKIAEAEVVITNQCFGVQIRSLVDPRAAKQE
ncbi:MAG: FliM/FliN family flagellar motor switch protein [Planctomycetota bacterium]|jgi:flagellar motor switch/type III secretory pathway protein FliN|nr:FliM/FliN family flagellar motor switch protein [Planctomycetota bacterium]